MAGFHTLYPRCMNVSEMRVGKTLSTLWAADYLMSQGLVHRALVIAPLSTLKRVWEDEIFTNFHGRRRASILYGDRAKRAQQLRAPADFAISSTTSVWLAGLCAQVRVSFSGNWPIKLYVNNRLIF